MFDLTGRRALVTGASSGIGRAMAEALAAAGADVIATGRDHDRLAEVAAASGARPIAADLSTAGGVRALIAAVDQVTDRIDILLNVAGVNPRPPLGEQDLDGFRAIVTPNLEAPFLLGQAYGPPMAERGWGRIVNVGSQQQQRAFGNSGSYGVSKAGLAGLTRSQSEAWARSGVCVNTVVPGLIATPMTAAVVADPERRAHFEQRSHVGRIGEPADFAGIAVFLASDACSFVTGQSIDVDGGLSVS